ncbi:MAG TPA: pilus assembly protein TadG-related protein [Terriglobales bacterium]|nr:pilus assembly protein TadG-related protein [Terriglobales bacterium]
MHKTSRKGKKRAKESGQAAVFLVLAMGLFLIGSMGFVIDGSNLWFHRQSAQTAADAACTAGAMDMLSAAEGATIPNSSWLEAPVDVQCSASGASGTTPAPCQYAGFNGYLASGLSAGRASSEVSVSSGSFSDIATDCDGSTSVCAASTTSTPYMQVDVTDRVPTSFIRMLGNIKTVDVHGKALCGLSNVLTPLPVVVLNPSEPRTFIGTNLSLSVIDGAQKAIQVNSIDAGAVDLAGNSTLSLTTSSNAAADFAVASREAEPDTVTLASGNWVSPAGMVSDPFANVASPENIKSSLADCSVGCVNYGEPRGTTDCPANASCDIYHPGHYPNAVGCGTGTVAICVGQGQGNATATGLAVFEPGIYYLDGDFVAGASSCLRPGGDTGIGGTFFYFSGSNTLNVSANSGQLQEFRSTRRGGRRLVFDCQSDAVDLTSRNCLSNIRSLTGNVLIAPCKGTYGDPLQANSAEGILFFQNRDSGSLQPTWNSGGAFGLIGNIYFHHCGSSAGSDGGAKCDSSAFTDTFNFGSGAQAYLFGSIVVDKLNVSEASPITIRLSPNAEYYTLKASLLQ